jgi:hypothetical protein
MGEFGGFRSRPRGDGLEKDSRLGNDQTWTLASGDPDRMKLLVESTTSEVTGCRCDGEEET